jgi:protein-L-isoaspartate(D-aspartate) O-methyltransferase
LLRVQAGQRVLEVGTGSGYQCSVLLTLGARVLTIEYNQVLFERTRQRLAELGYTGAHLYCGDGSVGLPAAAPFERILVTAAAPALPRPLLQQLTIGGVLVVPVGNEHVQRMVRVTRESQDGFAREEFDEFRFVPLRGAAGWGA